jgi:non-heme chloroperoxidase
MAYVEVGARVRLFAQDLGAGPPVVLIAGFGLHHAVWDRQVRLLADEHRVVCIDQRGHGRSDKPLDGYAVEQLAEDLDAAFDVLDISDCVLVGWSFGGQVAFRLAAIAPERVSRLVLVGSNGVRASRSERFPFGAEPGPTHAALVRQETADRLAARRATVASGFHHPPDPALLDWLVACSMAMPSWAAVACYDSMLNADLVEDLGRVKQPVLQIIGDADPVHSAKGARWLHEQLADSQLVELADCGHFPMFEAPDAFDAALLDFVATAPDGG